MQLNTGLYGLLSLGRFYNFFQRSVGSKNACIWLAKNFWKCQPGQTVLDIGCGTGDLLSFLPEGIDYTGIDLNEDYINLARERHGKRGKFFVGDINDLGTKQFPAKFDMIICNALLHHLEDGEVYRLLNTIRNLMHNQSRFLCLENCLLLHQTWISEWIIRMDRGRNLRNEDEFKRIFSEIFPGFKSNIVTGLLRIPYVHILIQCTIAN